MPRWEVWLTRLFLVLGGWAVVLIYFLIGLTTGDFSDLKEDWEAMKAGWRGEAGPW